MRTQAGHHHPDARPADAEPALDTLDSVGIGSDAADEIWISIGATAAKVREEVDLRRRLVRQRGGVAGNRKG